MILIWLKILFPYVLVAKSINNDCQNLNSIIAIGDICIQQMELLIGKVVQQFMNK